MCINDKVYIIRSEPTSSQTLRNVRVSSKGLSRADMLLDRFWISLNASSEAQVQEHSRGGIGVNILMLDEEC